MKGSYRIILDNRRVRFDFEIRRNITIIRGDSATGKTTLIDMLASYERDKNNSGITLQCDCPCVVLTEVRWEENLSAIHSCIVFIDEGGSFVVSEDFARAVRDSDNYYVIVTRDHLPNLPYSVEEIYGIRVSGKYAGLRKTYNELYKIYSHYERRSEARQILTEDSNAGYEFFCEVAK